jgi:4-hydroxy-tetrahydrodipicolinate synthase
VYSGDDATAMALMLVGGKGNISVTANVAPKAMHELCVASMKGDIATARAINDKVFNLHTNLFIEPNPVPVKWALAEMGMVSHSLRLPLVNLSAQYHDVVKSALREAGVLQ